ncbi:MAG: hypothetical protein K9K66_17030 [Desulfarculaceae bacterium]|nr:hypothetical protein [Desulfarculaceae bacterium]MCF8074296.1 hypothetical protein [Desulfarculaceae bacterium]MCF8103364.1 hypothetical protein [Desulfarculaceae bacterium]MCF8117846.1 hypothetical protein [Desulfarculaceae bacterium]
MPLALLVLAILLLLPVGQAQAYVGPGLGLGALGAIAGVIFSILLAAMAVFWYPIKRMFGLGKKKPPAGEDDPLD